MLHLDVNKVNFKKPLGRGSYGQIFPYGKDPNDEKWVVKQMKAEDTEELLQIMNEVVIGFSCHHPSILPFRGYHVETEKEKRRIESTKFFVYIKLPRMKESLYDVLKQNKNTPKIFIPEAKVLNYFYALASGLEYLHNRRIAHLDLKPANILCDEEGILKIADVGCALLAADEIDTTNYDRNSKFGTRAYLAPEGRINGWRSLKKSQYLRCDMWSLGAVMFEICSYRLPPENISDSSIHQNLECLEGKYSQRLIDIIASLLSYDASKRSTAREVRQAINEIRGEEAIGLLDLATSDFGTMNSLDLTINQPRMIQNRERQVSY